MLFIAYLLYREIRSMELELHFNAQTTQGIITLIC